MIETLYFVILGLTGFNLGAAFLLYYENENLSDSSRFLVGFSLTPFIIAAFSIVSNLTIPSSLNLLYFLIPLLLNVVFILFKKTQLWDIFRRSYATLKVASITTRIFWSSMLLFLCFLILSIFYNTRNNPIIIPHDAAIYANEALSFVKTGKIPDFSAKDFDLAPAHPHNFIYSAYISYGLRATTQSNFGYPNDFAGRAGVLIIFIFLMSAVASLVQNNQYTKGLFFIPIAGYFLLDPLNNLITYFFNVQSRDPFRIIAVILLVLFLGSFLEKKKFSKQDFLLLTSIVCVGVWAHTLNMLVLGMIFATWFLLELWYKKDKKYLFTVTASFGLGILIASTFYLKSFLDTGNFMGYGFYYYAYQGTPLWEAFLNSSRYVNRLDISFWSKVGNLFELNNYLGYMILLSLFVFGAALLKKNEKVPKDVSLLSLSILFLTIPYTGIFDFGKINLSQMFLFNNRYKSHWVILSLILCTYFVAYLAKKVKAGYAALMILLTILCLYSSIQLGVTFIFDKPGNFLETKRYNLYEIFQDLPHDRVVLIDNAGTDYYIDQSTLFIYDKRAWPIIQSKNKEEMSKNLNHLGIKYVLLERDIKGWWDQTYLYNYLESNGQLINKKVGEKYDFYLYSL